MTRLERIGAPAAILLIGALAVAGVIPAAVQLIATALFVGYALGEYRVMCMHAEQHRQLAVIAVEEAIITGHAILDHDAADDETRERIETDLPMFIRMLADLDNLGPRRHRFRRRRNHQAAALGREDSTDG
jgi:hypothetical protein